MAGTLRAWTLTGLGGPPAATHAVGSSFEAARRADAHKTSTVSLLTSTGER